MSVVMAVLALAGLLSVVVTCRYLRCAQQLMAGDANPPPGAPGSEGGGTTPVASHGGQAYLDVPQ